jgi:hypothetical protein
MSWARLVVRRPLMVGIVVLVASVVGISPTSAAPQACRATNLDTGVRYLGTGSNLQAAIDQAAPGGRIRVVGTCQGNFVIAKDLSLLGPSSLYDRTVLIGFAYGPVLAVEGASSDVLVKRVVVSESGNMGVLNEGNLTIVDASVTHNTNQGIVNAEQGRLLVLDSTISDNLANAGGGIYSLGVLKVVRSSVFHNQQTADAGGIYSGGQTTLIDSAVWGNVAEGFGGGILVDAGHLVLRGSTLISMNQAESGGGLWVVKGARLTLRDSAEVRENTASFGGGGIASYGAVIMENSAGVDMNSASAGGGINIRQASLIMNGSSHVNDNSASEGGGGILAARRRVIMNDQSRVSGNEAAGSGGGIESERGVVYLSDSARVTGNVAHGLGGGINAFESFVYACPSWVGAISPNTPDDPPPILASTCS